MKKSHITGILGFGLIVVVLLASGCATKELIRTSLRPPPEASTDHQTIVAKQYIPVTVGDNFIKKYDAGGHYIVHPDDWEGIMDELTYLEAELTKAEANQRGPPDARTDN